MFEDEYGESTVYKWLLAVAVVCFIIAGVLWSIDRIDESVTQHRMVNATNLAENMAGRVDLARGEYNKNVLDFADHWSTGFDDRLIAAESYFSSEGGVFRDLALANDALANSDRATAKKYLDQIEVKLGEATGVVDQILGPPAHPEQAFYLRLGQEGLQADAEIVLAQNCFPTSETQLMALINSSNYGIGVSELESAKLLLSQAISVNTVQVERGIIDRPMAYELAESAYAGCVRAPLVAAPPPPTSEPSTVIIIDNSSDDSSSDSGFGGSDWTDSGGSDWDSGSDSGGWDSGGDDGGSWDSGGDDW